MTRREALLRLTRVDPYRVLRVTSLASQEEIKKSYRELARQFHPDRETGNEEKFKRINEAYSMVDTPEKRIHHDVMVRLLTQPYPTPVRRAPVPPPPPKMPEKILSWTLFVAILFCGPVMMGSGIHSLVQGTGKDIAAGIVQIIMTCVWWPFLAIGCRHLPQMQKYIISRLPKKVRGFLDRF